MNNRFFYVLTAGFTAGIFISSFIKLGFSFFLFSLLLAGLVFVFGKFIAKQKTAIILLAIFLFSFSLGVLRYEIKDIKPAIDNLSGLVGQKINLTGIITDEPSVKDKSVELTVTENSGLKVLVLAPLFPEFKYGDLIQAEGKLVKPANFSTATSSDFDYVSYLAKDDIFYELSFANVTVISHGHGSWLKEKLFTFKNAFINKINLSIKEPESALLNGLILGAKNSLGQDWQDNFRRAGVSHIVALSGYNITIVAVGIMYLLSFLPRTISLSFGALGIILFALLTGGTATVLRASIMALLVLLAKATNRKYDITRALLLALIFMLIQNPKILVFDISFELSFLSTIALIFISPMIEPKLAFITEKHKLRELTVATLATQIFVLPFIFYKMGLISLVALPANLLILPFLPLIMLLGFLTGLMGFISLTLASPLAFLSSLVLTYMLKVIYFFSHLPFSAISIASFPIIFVIMIYGIYLWFILRKI